MRVVLCCVVLLSGAAAGCDGGSALPHDTHKRPSARTGTSHSAVRAKSVCGALATTPLSISPRCASSCLCLLLFVQAVVQSWRGKSAVSGAVVSGTPRAPQVARRCCEVLLLCMRAFMTRNARCTARDHRPFPARSSAAHHSSKVSTCGCWSSSSASAHASAPSLSVNSLQRAVSMMV